MCCFGRQMTVCRCEKTNLSLLAKGNSEGGETKAEDVKPLWSQGETQSDKQWKIEFRLNTGNVFVM